MIDIVSGIKSPELFFEILRIREKLSDKVHRVNDLAVPQRGWDSCGTLGHRKEHR